MILEVDNIGMNFSQGDRVIPALADVSFSVEAGDTLAVVGPSGSGKSTLLSLLAGLERPSHGSIRVRGQELTRMSEQQLSRFRAQSIGIVFQAFHLMPHLTALENVRLPLEIMGDQEAEPKARAVLETVGLAERLQHLPRQLSGGECQRIAIARAAVVNPAILLADEPSGNLDTVAGERVMDLLFSLVKDTGTTLVLVTHDLDLADRCARKLQLKGGRLACAS